MTVSDALTSGPMLYVPGTSPRLANIVSGDAFGDAQGIIVCLEDAVRPTETAAALLALTNCLGEPVVSQLYVRPRDPNILAEIRNGPYAGRIRGAVLPKVTTDNWLAWATVLQNSGWRWMPTLETRHAFDASHQREIRDAWLSSQMISDLLCVRVGGNDLLGLLGIRRGPRTSAYDTPLGQLLSLTVATFKPYGLQVAGPVCEFLEDQETVLAEARLDVQHGLCPKAAIHPAQLATIRRAYAVDIADFLAAKQVLEHDAPAVFAENGRMAETATHALWAEEILKRHEVFGTAPQRRQPQRLGTRQPSAIGKP